MYLVRQADGPDWTDDNSDDEDVSVPMTRKEKLDMLSYLRWFVQETDMAEANFSTIEKEIYVQASQSKRQKKRFETNVNSLFTQFALKSG